VSARPWLLVIALAIVLLSACGGEEASPTPTARPTQAPATSSPAASPAVPTLAPGTPVTLTIASISPTPAKIGDQVTVTFKTQPGAVVGFQITDSQGKSVAQTLVLVSSDGTATYTLAITGPQGTWRVEAAAGATIDDLLRLQAAPTPGPETATATFEVQ
jgi:hypothetical protein